jgi:hypothetical protein
MKKLIIIAVLVLSVILIIGTVAELRRMDSHEKNVSAIEVVIPTKQEIEDAGFPPVSEILEQWKMEREAEERRNKMIAEEKCEAKENSEKCEEIPLLNEGLK